MLKKYDIVIKNVVIGETRWNAQISTQQNYLSSKEHIIYGGGSPYDDYSIVSLNTGGSSAWWHDGNLEFVRHGTDEKLALR